VLPCVSLTPYFQVTNAEIDADLDLQAQSTDTSLVRAVTIGTETTGDASVHLPPTSIDTFQDKAARPLAWLPTH
jgi:hypothetical protein